jgi:hypothetical protein
MWAAALALIETLLGLALARAASSRAAAPLAFAFWTLVPLVFLGRTLLWGYDLVASARRRRRTAAGEHVT